MELSLQLQQKQVLSLKQQQSVAILQMNTLALSEYAREMAEENPLLEWSEEGESVLPRKERLLQKVEWLEETDGANRSLYQMEHEAEEGEMEPLKGSKGQTLREFLLFQINTQDIPEGHKTVLRFLTESTAESGYLEKDAIEMMMEKYPMKAQTAARILKEFQSLDPAGVGARSLKECLLIQLKRKDASVLAVKIVETYLEDVAKNHLQQIAKKEKVTMAEVLEAVKELRSCQPKPGSGFEGEEEISFIIPDVLVEEKDGTLVVTVNGSVIPHLNISHSYVKMLRAGADEQTEEYISEKLKQAEWVLQCINRRESTLHQVAECIVHRQNAFFTELYGQLVPLRLTDVAEELGLHESTISRAVKEKYLQCSRGVFLLSSFFSNGVAAAEGEVSADSIRNRLRDFISAEDKRKPLSDRELTEKLMSEGIQISRRTVAKYREGMGILGASGRKEH